MSDSHPVLKGEAFAALCLHEATHAAVALALGVHVEEVSVAGTLRVDAATESLYGVLSDTDIPAGGTRIPDQFLETHTREVLAAMAAPACISTGVDAIDHYGALEAEWALDQAAVRGVDPDAVLELAQTTTEAQSDAIYELARSLERDGVWRPGNTARPAAT